MKTPALSIVIPAFNTGQHLNGLVASLIEYFEGKLAFEIVVVDDSGNDEILSFTQPQVVYVKLKYNYGQHLATYAGILNALGNHVLTLDDDVIITEKTAEIILSRLKEPYDLQYFVNDDYDTSDEIKFFIIKNFFRFGLLRQPPKYGTSQRLFTRALAQKIIAQKYTFIYIDALLILHSENKMHCVHYIPKNKSPELKDRYKLHNRLFLLTNSFMYYSPLGIQIAVVLLATAVCLGLYYTAPIIGLAFILMFVAVVGLCMVGYTRATAITDVTLHDH